ncbi:MAG: hypothetical protein ACYC8T_12755 [Myxococcaceae bacterium]
MSPGVGDEVRRVADEFEKVADQHHREIARALEALAHRVAELETLVKLDHDLLQRVLDRLDPDHPPL